MSDQLPLIGPRGGLRPRPPRSGDHGGTATVRAVEVLVDAKVPQLARAFTYGVPASLDDQVQPGVRVRVRLAGRLTDGFVTGAGDPGYDGAIHQLEGVISAVPVLTEDVLGLCQAVADHYAGTVPDVVRLAVPPRAAAAERGWAPAARRPAVAPPRASGLAGHPFVAAAAEGQALRAAWSAPPAQAWADELATTAAVMAARGRGVLIVVPDARDLDLVAPALLDRIDPAAVAVLSADAGPAQRYREFLRVLSGAAIVVVGTRAAAFAPVRDLGLAVVWNDGDASLAEQRAPYPHAREVLALRSHLAGCALLLAGHTRSTEAQRWVEAGWLHDVTDRELVRTRRPRAFATADRVRSPFDATRRLPAAAVDALRTGLASGPVLVQVARRGYVPVTACQECRAIAECPRCAGPVQLTAAAAVSCRRCGWQEPFSCPQCGGGQLRAVRTGARRDAEELGRLLPGVPVVVSTGDHPIARVGPEPVVVVSTPGVEPAAVAGYFAGALPDAQDDLWRVGLRAREEAVRRWLDAASLLRPDAPLAVVADPGDPAVQALIRWDPTGFAAGELARRRELHLPPAEQVVQLDGAEPDVTAVLAGVGEGHQVTALGPLPLDDGEPGQVRALVRAAEFAPMLRDLHAAVLHRAAAKLGKPVRVQVDPASLE